MENNIQIIKDWLGTGSINIFGLPFSGKDTVGVRLAETLDARFLSSGMILRAIQEEDLDLKKEMIKGQLVDQVKFIDIITPYFGLSELKGKPLILSSIGRWSGEEQPIMEAAKNGGHEIKAAVLLNISESETEKRRLIALQSNDRGGRLDDTEEKAMITRIAEFNKKTIPVIETYLNLGLLVRVNAHDDRDTVFANTINALAEFAKRAQK